MARKKKCSLENAAELEFQGVNVDTPSHADLMKQASPALTIVLLANGLLRKDSVELVASLEEVGAEATSSLLDDLETAGD
jgi:hypothetical protein